MCGICGIYRIDGGPVDKNTIVAMNDTLGHRGPDAEGYHVEKSAGMGHRRLSIIDLDTGNQPIYNEENTICVVFNGEIYNFQELREELVRSGHVFGTNTDTEAIVHAYEQWGTNCLEKFRGMFAFAIWDSGKNRFFLARDRLGIKPLYYAEHDGFFSFASEIKALLKIPEMERDLDLEAFSDYLSLGYVPAPKSIFKRIRKLPAGHYMIWDKDGIAVREYWDIDFVEERGIPEERWVRSLGEHLREAVRLRLISDVPLGSFLSGGIDSSLVTALMANISDGPVLTNSIGFEMDSYNELPFARRTAEFFKTRHREYTVKPNISDVVEMLAYFFDEPFADASAIPAYHVSKMARQNATVCLSGDGGDENFAGYRRYCFDLFENRIRGIVPSFARRIAFGSLGALYPKADWLPRPLRAKTLLQNLALDPLDAYFNSVSRLLPNEKEKVSSGDVRRSLAGYDSKEVFRSHFRRAGTPDPLSKVQYLDIKTYLVDDILTKVDRTSMANSLEVRVPILDHRVMELAAKMPSNLKLRGGVSKYILKKVAEKYLPPEILNRKKMGFDMPVKEWLKKELRPLGEEILLGSKFKSRGLFDGKHSKWMWEQHLRGFRDFGRQLWVLLSFELWARTYLDRN